MLDHHDRVGAAGEHAAGGDDAGLVGADPGDGGDAGGEQVGGQVQDGGGVGGGALRVLRAEGEAVHAGAVEAGDVDLGEDVLGEDAAEGVVEGDGLGAQRG